MIAPNPVHTTNSAALTTPSCIQLVRGAPASPVLCVSFGEVMDRLRSRSGLTAGPPRFVGLRDPSQGYHRVRAGAAGSATSPGPRA